MTMFLNQMLGCLIIAAGIGGAVGWLLRHVSAGTITQQLENVTAMMHLKEQMLEKARHQLRDAASKAQPIENEPMAPHTLSHSNQEERSPQEPSAIIANQCVDTDRLLARLQESESAGGWVEWLDVQLTERDEQHRIALHEVEQQLAERDRRIREFEYLHEQLMKQAEDNEALKAAYTQAVAQQIDKAA
ncbi:MAG TPA: hypothetical protein VLM19_03720 [Nitrospiraceae bacterium]|nr:hypothetical protein [Nitrospiraceae bacterium]